MYQWVCEYRQTSNSTTGGFIISIMVEKGVELEEGGDIRGFTVYIVISVRIDTHVIVE